MNYTIQIDTKKNKYYFDKVLMLTETISYPIITNYDDYTFNDYYLNMNTARIKKDREYYKNAVTIYSSFKEENIPYTPYEILVTTTVTLNKDNIISLFIDDYEYTKGAHGNTVRTGNTWDMKQNKLLSLSEILTGNYKDTILDIIKEEAHYRAAKGNISYFDNLDKNIETYFNEDNFFLDRNGINIFYPLYTIAPYYIGIQVFNIPYHLLNINENYHLL